MLKKPERTQTQVSNLKLLKRLDSLGGSVLPSKLGILEANRRRAPLQGQRLLQTTETGTDNWLLTPSSLGHVSLEHLLLMLEFARS